MIIIVMVYSDTIDFFFICQYSHSCYDEVAAIVLDGGGGKHHRGLLRAIL